MTRVRLVGADELGAMTSSVAQCVAAFARHGSQHFIANLRTTMVGLEVDDGAILPVTVNGSEIGDAFPCLPHSAYALYGRFELDRIDTGLARPLLIGAARIAGALLRAARINRVVHVNNMPTSTNLHGAWAHSDVMPIRRCLVERFLDHFLAVRSLSEWGDAELMRKLARDGWRLVPAREIFVMDAPRVQWTRRRNGRADVELLAEIAGTMANLDTLAKGDAERIAQLYRDLYVAKYTPLNPDFTASFVALTHATGVLRYRGIRDAGGILAAVVATAQDTVTLCPQFIAYDQTRPRSAGLYRAAMAAGVMMACEAGRKLNWSAGVGDYKTSRGARGVVEYNAFYDRHLARPRRLALAALDKTVRRLAMPLVRAGDG